MPLMVDINNKSEIKHFSLAKDILDSHLCMRKRHMINILLSFSVGSGLGRSREIVATDLFIFVLFVAQHCSNSEAIKRQSSADRN